MNYPAEAKAIADASATPETRLMALGLMLPKPPAAVGAYEPWARYANFITTSFQLPFDGETLRHVGLLGDTVSTQDGVAAARLCALNGLAQLAEAAGSLANVRLIRLDGHVGCTQDYDDMPLVLDAASRLLQDVLGERGRHARTALGHHVMPLGAPVMLGFFAEIITTERGLA
ncbi:Atu1372/SO_1960 family protein [Paraburkholderia strydomiana]|uniref:Atu1372/SO_1960 family protein n=1 Tax=Paraburkholderia strydomiana TaxID=1245417 RepID=A0ABW9ES42_9BURK